MKALVDLRRTHERLYDAFCLVQEYLEAGQVENAKSFVEDVVNSFEPMSEKLNDCYPGPFWKGIDAKSGLFKKLGWFLDNHGVLYDDWGFQERILQAKLDEIPGLKEENECEV